MAMLKNSYGGKFYGNHIVKHCIPLNNEQKDTEINWINGIKNYTIVLNITKL